MNLAEKYSLPKYLADFRDYHKGETIIHQFKNDRFRYVEEGRAKAESRIRSMFEAEEQQRRASAQAASDALDPFYFDVDLECED